MRLFPLLLAGCATTPWGTWAFTLAVTPATGDECAVSTTHNFTGAYAPESTTVVDESWTTTTTSSDSPALFFARLEAYGQGSMLIVGDEALPGTHNEDGSWTFAWEGESTDETVATHASGYDYTAYAASTSTLKIKGTFNTETFTGDYLPQTTSLQKWDESDTWSDEAAAYVGDNGEAPVGTYLVLSDGAGGEIAANNNRAVYDCETATCALTVESTCDYRYALTGQLTEFGPDDAGWLEGAGQPAGL